jgi:hypothetical protein
LSGGEGMIRTTTADINQDRRGICFSSFNNVLVHWVLVSDEVDEAEATDARVRVFRALLPWKSEPKLRYVGIGRGMELTML